MYPVKAGMLLTYTPSVRGKALCSHKCQQHEVRSNLHHWHGRRVFLNYLKALSMSHLETIFNNVGRKIQPDTTNQSSPTKQSNREKGGTALKDENQREMFYKRFS